MLDSAFRLTRLQMAFGAMGLSALVALAAGGAGYYLGLRTAKAEGDAALNALKQTQATALVDAEQQARAKEHELNQLAHALGLQLLQERTQHAQEADQLKRRIDRVTSQYRTTLDAPLQPAPRCVFTNGFVSMWNDAIGAGAMPTANASTGATDTTDPAEAIDSGVQQADVLAHLTDYGQRCRDLESQLNRVIDWVQEGRQ